MFKKIEEKCKSLLILGRYNNLSGVFLLMWPCYWGTLSYLNVNDNFLKNLILFSIGSLVMRGAGCCINDLFDKDFDKKIKRTKNRPLARGIVNIQEAIVFTILQLFIGLIVVLQFELKVIIFSFSIIPLVFIYPLLKRFTYFPQILLGLIFNWGIIVGHLSQSDTFDFNVLFLYFAGVLLTTCYDTIYGFQDLRDDKKLGLKSLAILFERSNYMILFFYSISSFFFLIFFLKNFSNNFISCICGMLIFVHLTQQYLSFKRRTDLMQIFKSNVLLGGAISLMIIIQSYL